MTLLKNLNHIDLESFIITPKRKVLLVSKPNCSPCQVFRACLEEISEPLMEVDIEVAFFRAPNKVEFEIPRLGTSVKFFPSLFLISKSCEIEGKLLGALNASDKVNSLRIIKWLERFID